MQLNYYSDIKHMYNNIKWKAKKWLWEGNLFVYILLLKIDIGDRFNIKPMFLLSMYYHFMGQSFQIIDSKFSKPGWCPVLVKAVM